MATEDLVPAHCTSIAFSFEPGTLWINKDGSGQLVIAESDFSCEDDRCEGPDGPEGSVHWIARMAPQEVVALRDFLNGSKTARQSLTGSLRALNDAAYAALNAGNDTTQFPDLNREKLRQIARLSDEMVDNPMVRI